MFDKVAGHCKVRDLDVEVLFIKLKKAKSKTGARTPIRCQSSNECPRSAFCKFVNPLASHIPVDFIDTPTKTAEAS